MDLPAITLAQRAAMSADMVYELMGRVRSGAVDDHLPKRPDVSEWLGLYSDHRRLTVGVADALPEYLGAGSEVRGLLDGSREISTWANDHPDELLTLHREVTDYHLMRHVRFGLRLRKRLYKRHLKEAAATLRGEATNEAEDFGQRLAASPELLFYFRVTLPCLCLYQRLPAMLMRHARRGNIEAIEQLVRLDDLAVHDPAIVAWWNDATGSTRHERRDMLHRWTMEGLDHGRFNLRQIKVALGAWISVMVETIGMRWCNTEKRMKPGRITAGQIQALFDAVAKDRAPRPRKHIRDSDLGDLQIDSLRRMMGRHKHLWRVVIGGGQKFGWFRPGVEAVFAESCSASWPNKANNAGNKRRQQPAAGRCIS